MDPEIVYSSPFEIICRIDGGAGIKDNTGEKYERAPAGTRWNKKMLCFFFKLVQKSLSNLHIVKEPAKINSGKESANSSSIQGAATSVARLWV